MSKLSVDTIILDIDGVLLDVSNSYRKASVLSAQKYLEELGCKPGNIPLEETQFLKQAGDFNNDWDCAYAFALYYMIKLDSFTTLSFEEFVKELKQRGGGLSALMKYAEEITNDKFPYFMCKWDKSRIKEIFQRLYLDENFTGMISKEPVIITQETLDFLKNYKLAVLTGRPRDEAEFAVKRIGLGNVPMLTMDDLTEAQQKPNPYALLELKRRVNGKSVAYVGDAIDDVRIVKNAGKDFFSISVLSAAFSNPSFEELLKSEGSDAVIPDINSIKEVLK